MAGVGKRKEGKYNKKEAYCRAFLCGRTVGEIARFFSVTEQAVSVALSAEGLLSKKDKVMARAIAKKDKEILKLKEQIKKFQAQKSGEKVN